MKKNQKRIVLGAVVLCLLLFLYWWGGNAPSLHGWKAEKTPSESAAQQEWPQWLLEKENLGTDAPEEAEAEPSAAETPIEEKDKEEKTRPQEGEPSAAAKGDMSYSKESGMEISDETGKDPYQTEPVPKGKPIPQESVETDESATEYTCTLSVRCDTVLGHMEALPKGKVALIPKDGVILSEREVVFYDGESVFQVLRRELRRNQIHMEFVNTPIYHSAYVEGIANLYEFDCGELSGWHYRVNGWFPNYGSSRYCLKAGDRVEWLYTCDRGEDLGHVFPEDGGQRDA